MRTEQLKSELRAILDLEERTPTDWAAVDQRCLDLNGRLIAEGPLNSPQVIGQFLDDPDMRRRDVQYARRQREQLRQWLESKGG